MTEIAITKIEDDNWGRKRFMDIEAKRILVAVDGYLHTTSACGEPDCPVKDDIEVCYVEPEHFSKEIKQALSYQEKHLHKLHG